MTEKALRGELQTPAPLGYIMTDGLLTPDYIEAALVKKIFSMYAYENMSSSKIAEYLNAAGFLTKKGNPFQKRTVDYILKNPVYIGKIRWSRKNEAAIVTNGRHTAIIDEKTYTIANEKISEKQKKSERKAASHLLLGLLKCKRCGGNMYLCGKIFRCGNYLNKKCAYSQGLSAVKAERSIKVRIAADLGEYRNLRDVIDVVYYDKESGLFDIHYIKNP